MKKTIITFITVCFIFLIAISMTKANENNKKNSSNEQKDIASKIIRFHVIANSDKEEDQKLKLKVRDEILKYIEPKLTGCKTIEESRKIIMNNDKQMFKIAEKFIKNNGYNYKVKSSLSHENFPVKTYGNITLPQGKYEAYRIIIGEGSGHNWWCVMFPPLCFVDITKSEVACKETEKRMKTVLDEEQYELVDNMHNNAKQNKIKFKFKIVELIQELIK